MNLSGAVFEIQAVKLLGRSDTGGEQGDTDNGDFFSVSVYNMKRDKKKWRR